MKYLRWVNTFLATPSEERKSWVEELIQGFRDQRKGKASPTMKYLSDVLSDGKEYDLVGVIPGIEYMKVEGPADELNCIWEHPHMNPQLLYKHKKLPVFIIAGPGLRWNESILNESGISDQPVRGITN